MATPPVWQLTEPGIETQEPMFDHFDTSFHPGAADGRSATPALPSSPSNPVVASPIDEFAGLEERILRAVELLRSERQARTVAEARAAALQLELTDAQSRSAEVEILHEQIASLRAEREQVRQRVDRLLNQLDSLEI